MRRNLTEQEFNVWKEKTARARGCPFWACSKAMFNDFCGNSSICNVLYDYKMYSTKKWAKECDEKFVEDEKEETPTKICPSCTGTMCLKVNTENELIGKSWCKLMNDNYEARGIKVNRSWEKYILSVGVWMLPILGEQAYLEAMEKIASGESIEPGKIQK